MYRAIVRYGLPMGLLAALLVLAMSACGGPERSRPRPLPEDAQALRPGGYYSERFEPSLSFRVGEGWTSGLEISDGLFITRGEAAVLGFANVQEVYRPTKKGTPDMVDSPEDIVGWFQRHPYLRTDKPEPVTVGGVKGEQFDVVVEDLPEDHSGECGSNCVDIFRLSQWLPVAQFEEDKVRVIVLEDVNGETVIIGVGGPATEFDEHAAEARKVLESVEWEGA
jgi:hypothetical protein